MDIIPALSFAIALLVSFSVIQAISNEEPGRANVFAFIVAINLFLGLINL